MKIFFGIKKLLLLITCLWSGMLFSNIAFAKDIVVEDAYIRATIPGTSVSSAYMNITNNGLKATRLIGAGADISDRVEIHQHLMADGMMKMRKVDGLEIKPNQQMMLMPSGYHLMIFDLDKPLNDGESVKVQLHFSHGESQEIEVPVKSIKRRTAKKHHHQHH